MENNGIVDTSFKIKKFKCFRNEEQGFDRVYPINIIIGKNNSGKSTLIDLIEKINEIKDKKISTDAEEGSEIIIANKINDAYLNKVTSTFINKQVPGASFNVWNSNIRNSIKAASNDYVVLRKPLQFNSLILDAHSEVSQSQYKQSYIDALTDIFSNSIFRRINAERDIKSDIKVTEELNLQADGNGSTNIFREIINSSKYHPDLILETLFTIFKSIVEPDILFTNIYARTNATGWEIYFRDTKNNIIPLSQMGSGIKTVLLVLLNLIVIPEITNSSKKSDFIFCFEELENNLHPSLQRRLFNYISKYVEENKSTFFITTHSSLVIDLFSKNPLAQILHVENKDGKATVKTIETTLDGRNILNDLGYKASDVLLSNGVIWVEGPSDVVYIELLLDLYCKQQGIDLTKYSFTIQVLATAVWRYAGFTDEDWDNKDLQNKLINLTKLNHNHLIVLDRDKNYELKSPEDWGSFENGTGQNKAKLIHESMVNAGHKSDNLESNYDGDTKNNQLHFWINDGTFETYLEHFIDNKGKDNFEKYFQKKTKNSYFQKKTKDKDYSISKVELAAQIADFARSLNFEDFAPKDSSLENKIIRLVNTIEYWNR